MTNTPNPHSWFLKGWAGHHVAAATVISFTWFWFAPAFFTLFMVITEGPGEALMIFFVSCVVAALVSFLFALALYPILQRLVRGFLPHAKSGGEIFLALVLPQQLVIWAGPFFIALADPVFLPTSSNGFLWFWLLLSLHAMVHLFRYSARMYADYQNSPALRKFKDETSDPSTGIPGPSGA